MATSGRVGTGLLGTFGLALACLMAYTLAYEGCAGPWTPPHAPGAAAEVAVFFPDRRDWSHFRRAVEACGRRGLCKAVPGADEDGSIEVETPVKGRRVRFAWHGIRGVGETRVEVERIARLDPPPVAVIGSSTTVLTVALAGPLSEEGAAGPALLIPWATSVQAWGSGRGSRPTPLLEIDRGRTFRFCPNNARLAESVVGCLAEHDGKTPPGKVFLVVDPLDPYSVDLADCFRRAIRAHAPAAEIVERPDAVGMPTVARSPGAVMTPSVAEASLADAIWSTAEEAPEGRPTWVVLPLQGDPARRMLAALQSRSSWQAGGKGEGPLRVVSGDGIGRETLEVVAGRKSFPIWCASTSSTCPKDLGVTNDTQTLAEIVSAVLLAVEGPSIGDPNPGVIVEGIRKIDLPADHPSAFGRPLRFATDGERKDDPGYVLAARPGMPTVSEFELGKAGRWVAVEARP